MASISLTSGKFADLNFAEEKLLERFERAGIKSLTDLCLYSSLELALKFRLSLNASEKFMEKLLSNLKIKAKNVFQMIEEMTDDFIPTGLPSLNRFLNGGLRRGSLVELCGSWGSGKTQMCLHLTAQCCLMSLRSIYIDTEHTFSPIRLLNMLQNNDENRRNLLELVRTETIFDYESLMELLHSIEAQLEEDNSENLRPALLIIDSVAAPMRMSTNGYTQEYCLLQFTDAVKRLATRFNLLVVVTNQVTTKRRSVVLDEKAESSISNEFYTSVALGKAWTYSVNVRLAICYQGDSRRQLIIGKSIESASHAVNFRILTRGIEEINENRRSFGKLIQADEMQLIGKQIRP